MERLQARPTTPDVMISLASHPVVGGPATGAPDPVDGRVLPLQVTGGQSAIKAEEKRLRAEIAALPEGSQWDREEL